MTRKTIWRSMVVLAILSGSILLNLLLVRALRARFESQLRLQVWPVGPPVLPAISAPPTGATQTVLLLGDSRMAEWNFPPHPQWRVVNAGVGGLTTAQIRLRVHGWLEEFRPDVVVLQAGINDLKLLGLRPEWSSVIVAQAASNLTAIVSDCTGRRIQVIVLETWPASAPDLLRRAVWSEAIPRSVEELNVQLRMLNSAEREIRVLDLFKKAGLRPGADQYRDTLHLKAETYQQLTPVLIRELEPLLRPGK